MLEKLKTYGKNKDEVKIYTATIGLTNDKLVSRMVTGEAEPIWGFTAESLNDGTRIKFNQNSTINNKDGKNYRKIGWDKILNCIYGLAGTRYSTASMATPSTWNATTSVVLHGLR